MNNAIAALQIKTNVLMLTITKGTKRRASNIRMRGLISRLKNDTLHCLSVQPTG
jgi:hypothetical protein